MKWHRIREGQRPNRDICASPRGRAFTVLVEPLFLKIRRRERILGSPAGDEGAHGTAAATDPRPNIDRVSESGDIKPGHAGYRGTPRIGDHLSPAHSAVATDIFADSGSQRLSELCNLSEKQPLAKEPSRFRTKRQDLLEKYIFSEGWRDLFVTPPSGAVSHQNHAPASVEVKPNFDWALKSAP